MNSFKLSVVVICSLSLFSGHLCGAGPLRLFFEVGPKVFEVQKLDKGLPILDSPVDSNVDRIGFGGKWSYSGELPLDSEYMSRNVDYVLKRLPKNYAKRNDPDSYFAYLSSLSTSQLGWAETTDRDRPIVFAWLTGDVIEDIVVSSIRGYRLNYEYLSTSRKNLSPDGVMVAWLVGEDGSLVRLKEDEASESNLLRAALNGDMDRVQLLLEADSSRLQEKDEEESTVLMYAARGGRLKVVNYLLEKGIKRYEVNRDRIGALEIAADGGWFDIVKALAPQKLKGSGQRLQYSVAAVNAFNDGYDQIAIHLLDLGAKIDLNKKSAPEAAMKRVAVGSIDLWRWMTREFDIDTSFSKDGLNFLHLAAGYADTALLEELREGGASVTQLSANNISPLLMACGSGNREAICWFMENGASEGEATERDLVLYAIKERVPDAVSCLIDYGVNVNRSEVKGVSPLMFAASLEEREIAETLLMAGAVWDFDSPYSDACLRQVLRMDSPSLVEGLVEQGLDLNSKLYGETRFFDVASFYGASELITQMEKGWDSLESKLVSKRPEIEFRTNIEYPYALQEKYGDVEAIIRLGVLKSGRVGMIEVAEDVPSEVAALMESDLQKWRFKPLDFEDDEAVAVVKFKLPLKMTLSSEDVLALKDVDELPRALYQIDPNYPYGLKIQGIGGYVQLEWIIDRDGGIRFPKVIKSSHKDFEEMAVNSIKQSRWRPARKNGIPVPVRVVQRMKFNP